jgi:hypothetical protein
MKKLGLWAPESLRVLPEPTPLFYEEAAWGESTRRDRLATLLPWQRITFLGRPTTSPPLLVA